MIRWALAEISSRSQETPRACMSSISLSSTAGSTTTPLPITGIEWVDSTPDGSR